MINKTRRLTRHISNGGVCGLPSAVLLFKFQPRLIMTRFESRHYSYAQRSGTILKKRTTMIITSQKSYKRIERIELVMLFLCLFFWLSNYSLTGIWSDILFWYFSILINVLCLILLLKNRENIKHFKTRKFIWIIALVSNIVVFIIFPLTGYYNVKNVNNGMITKYNLYSGLSLMHRKAYFLKTDNMCNDGIYWETEILNFLPIFEHKIKEHDCYKLSDRDELK